MGFAQLLKNNFRYYWRTNFAVIAGVATAVAVLSGALVVGDSVRGSLRDLFLQRLGRTDQVVTAPRFFREQLAVDLQQQSQFQSAGFESACPLIALTGTVSEPSGNRAGGVQVYGVDERFWQFHGRQKEAPHNREVFVSQSLARELHSRTGDSLLLTIEKPSEVPRESLYGRKEDIGHTLRLTIKEELSAADLGEFTMQPQQGTVRAVFVPLSLLQKDLEVVGQVNSTLISSKNSAADRTAVLETILKQAATLDDFDVKLRTIEDQRTISLERGSTLIDATLADRTTHAASSDFNISPIFSYVVNNISDSERAVPYSLVTAVDDEMFGKLAGEYNSSDLPIVLNAWTAHDLSAKTGDMITLDFFVWQDDGRLGTRNAKFRVVSIQPISGVAADRNLVPHYPGISESESMADWDPPFPVDLNRIRKQDEDYWKQYRTTPKAFIRLADGQRLWQSRFGNLTSLRLTPKSDTPLTSASTVLGKKLTEALDPATMGLMALPVREQGLGAARGATDFGEYFLYFSFFLVISALLLTALFFKLGIEQRLREIGLLQAIGFSPARIRSQFLWEGLLLTAIGSVVGVIGALAYAQLLMIGLRTFWVGAVGTTMLTLHWSAMSLIIGAAGGIIAALLCIFWTLRQVTRASTRSLLLATISDALPTARAGFGGVRLLLAVGFTVIGLVLVIVASLHLINQTAAFFSAGTVFLIALLLYQSVWLRRRGHLIRGHGWSSMARMGFRNTTYRPGRSVLCIALIASATFIIVAVDAFRHDNLTSAQDKKSGSGGYPLLAESMLPVIRDLNSAEGREALNLTGSSNTAVLDQAQFTRFRVKPGDDTSCLNLYQPTSPKILGAGENFIEQNRFAFQSSVDTSPGEKSNPWLLLHRDLGSDVVPVVADANSLTYVLHLKLGDEFVLNRSEGPVRLRIVAALADSIFQSELIMTEKNFVRLFPHEEGYRFFLIDTPPNDLEAVSNALEDQLSDLGFDVMPTSERLASFHRVENTYLSTFQMLGGLGLLLGTFGMAAVLLRNLLERRREIALLGAVGYNAGDFTLMTTAENALLLCSGLAIGAVAAALAIAPVFVARGGRLPDVTLIVLLFAVLISGLTVSIVATWFALRSPIVEALRAE